MVEKKGAGAKPTRGGARPKAGRPRRAGADDAILDAALALLLAKGYSGLTLEEVAARAGVAVTTIYRRWPTKAALVATAASTFTWGTLTPPATGSVAEDLRELLKSSYDLFVTGQGRFIEALVRESGQAPELTGIVQQAIHDRRRVYHVVLNRAIARGEVPAEIDQDIVLDSLLGIFWTRLLVTLDPFPPDFADLVVDLVLPGLLTARVPRVLGEEPPSALDGQVLGERYRRRRGGSAASG
jgi:AcrR family transcriptional regulator